MSSARAKAGRPGRQWRSSSPTVKGFGVLDKSGTVCALRLTKLGFFFLKKNFFRFKKLETRPCKLSTSRRLMAFLDIP